MKKRDLLGLHNIQKEIHENAVAHGWWDGESRNIGESIALIHSEASEALEAKRKGDPESTKIPGHSNFAEELSDIVIRVLDLAEGEGIDLYKTLNAKHEYNKNRPYRHGKKF